MNKVTGATVVAVVTVLLLVGCGVPLDSKPQALNVTTTTSAVATTDANTGNPANTVSLFFVSGDKVQESTQNLKETPTIELALKKLLSGPIPKGFTTSIPPSTHLLDVSVDKRRVAINLSREMENVSSDPERFAYAQLTFTALQFEEYSEVTFLIEGTSIDTPTDNGNRKFVTSNDYRAQLRPG